MAIKFLNTVIVEETSTNNLIGGSINLATSYGWTIPSGTFTQRVGYYGGDFTLNGQAAENGMQRGLGPFNDRQLLWTTAGSTDNDADGGWNKTLTNLDIDSSYLSVVYFKRVSSNTAGTFYHGTGNNILNLNGTANTNPYFTVRALSALDQNVWYVSIGVIQSNSDSNTTAYTDISGLYRLDTGAKIANVNAYKFDTNGATLSRGHRAYLYYSTDVDVVAQFANPGFYKIDGDQPKLQDIIGGDNGDVFWSASGDNIYNENSGNVGIATTSPAAKLDIINPGLSTMLRLSNTEANATTKYGAILGRHYTNAEENVTGMLITSSSNSLTGQTVSIGGGISSANAVNEIKFYTAANNTTLTGSERMRITSSGNVGIGTINPGAKLDVNGTVVSQGGNYVTANANVSDAAYVVKQNDKIYSETGAGYLRNLIYHDVNGSIQIGQDGTAIITDIIMKPGTSGNVIFRTSSNSETARINSSGNVGIGVTNPTAKLQVDGDIDTISGDGYLINGMAWAYEASSLLSLGNWDGNDFETRIMDENSNEVLRVVGGGVGVGTTSPGSKLDIVGATTTGTSSLLRVRTTDNPNAPEKVVGFYVNTNTERGFISVNQYATAYSTSSDYRLKENIVPISNGVERLKELNPCRFNFIGTDYAVDGFLAHEAAEVVPEAVTGDKDAVDEDNNPSYQGIDQSKVVPLLTAALQEAIEKIEQLEIRIQTLENN